MKLVSIDEMPKLDDIKDVSFDDLVNIYKICNKMQHICDVENGLGISAVQLGIPLNLFIIQANASSRFGKKGQYGYFLNCKYRPQHNSKDVMSIEGCLSIRSKDGQLRHFKVKRYTDILIDGFILNENMELEELVDEPISVLEQSIVFQHEIDHSSAILISDKGQEVVLW